MGCAKGQFPTPYLGLPLTILKPAKEQFMPLVERIEKKLGGWKGKFISKGGRLQLVKSVLSSIPIYHMMCFRLPQWVIMRIDKVRRQFLWGKPTDLKRGISLTNWTVVCTPKVWGGLGLSNLNLVNIALLLRWWWKAYHEPLCLWSMTVELLRRRGTAREGPKFWLITGSFFWGQLRKLKQIFEWSTSWIVGDGTSISYWFDTWQGRPRVTDLGQVHTDEHISLRDAYQALSMIDPTMNLQVPISFTDREDAIIWLWENSGIYSAKSAYEMLSGGGIIKWHFNFVWGLKIPQSVKLFVYFLLQGKLLTRDVLAKRGMFFGLQCPLCMNCPRESILHIIYLCSVAVEVWFHTHQILGFKIFKPAGTITEVWQASWLLAKTSSTISKIGRAHV